MLKDIGCKRAKFVSTVLRLYDIDTCDYSNLQDQYSRDVKKLKNSWNITIRIFFYLTRETHGYFIEPISNAPHIKTVLCTRFVQFVTSLSNCHKLCIGLLIGLSKHD